MAHSEKTIRALLDEADVAAGGDRPQDIRIADERFWRRVAAEGSLGLGESYVDGWWEANELDVFFCQITRCRLGERVREPGRLAGLLAARLANPQSRRRSRRVTERHYDLDNEFYEAMLDPWMQYSCGYWIGGAKSLAEAQERKLDLACRKLRLRSGHRVLELGGGWGGFARFAAERYGCEVTMYNLSKEQAIYAAAFCKGLPVNVRNRDYREAEGRYDRVVSIGLCEHVGARNYRSFLELKRRCLEEEGLALLHTIGRRQPGGATDPWIRKYIFPGGMLPSLSQLSAAAEGLFVIEDAHNFGADYDPTLMAWRDNFERAWPRFRARRGGERFERMWRYYLLCCAGAFRSRDLQLWQLVLSPQGVAGGYAAPR